MVDDAPTIFYDFEAFGSVLEPRPHMERIATSQQKSDRAIEVGDHPHIFYFTGKRKIFEVPTAIGTVATAAAHQNRYSTDRLIGAANMFDIMPTSACPADVPLTTDLEKARADARQAFKALAPSAEQESVLSALGRIGKATLKHKIRKRVELVTRAAGGKFPDLALVTDQAVVCRNFYVHGSPGRFDYGIPGEYSATSTCTNSSGFTPAQPATRARSGCSASSSSLGQHQLVRVVVEAAAVAHDPTQSRVFVVLRFLQRQLPDHLDERGLLVPGQELFLSDQAVW